MRFMSPWKPHAENDTLFKRSQLSCLVLKAVILHALQHFISLGRFAECQLEAVVQQMENVSIILASIMEMNSGKYYYLNRLKAFPILNIYIDFTLVKY